MLLLLSLFACHPPTSAPPDAPTTKTPWGRLYLPQLTAQGAWLFDVLPSSLVCGKEASYVKCAAFTLPVVTEETIVWLESVPGVYSSDGGLEVLAPQVLLFDEEWEQVSEVRAAGFAPVLKGKKGVMRGQFRIKPGDRARYALILSTRWNVDEPAWEADGAPIWSNVGQVRVVIDP
jgi:hypothetical protein